MAATEKRKNNRIRESLGDNILKIFVYAMVILLSLACLLPLLNVLASSFSSVESLNAGKVSFWPIGFNVDAYRTILENGQLMRSMLFSMRITVVHVAFTLVMTVLCAYPLSHKDLVGKSFIWPFILFTMYFGGGMIPHYILIRDLNMINTMWSLIIPGLISTYNMILMRSFFSSIPEALREAAIVDGANDATTLVKIILPLSKSMLATIALFYAVGRWNGVQDGMIYINDPSKYILQVRLKNIIISSTALTELMQEGQNNQTILQTQQVRSAALVFSLIPVMIVYPFLQKYFVKGVMIGSVKG
jgi:putative aldouronate transport system permease protein